MGAEKDGGKSIKAEDIKTEPVIKDEYFEVGYSEQTVKSALEIKDEFTVKEENADMFKEVEPNMREMHHSSDECDDDPMQGGQFWMLRGSGIGDLRCTDTRQILKADNSCQTLIQAEKLSDVGLFELCNPHLLSSNTTQRLLHPLYKSPSGCGDAVQLARIHLSPKPQRMSRRRRGFKRQKEEVGENPSKGKEYQRMREESWKRMREESWKRRMDFTSRNFHDEPVWGHRNHKYARYI